MIKAPTPNGDEQVRALLTRYECPVLFHEVRTRFLGNIATPNMTISPMKVVRDLWGGELPELESIEAANELVGALIGGLWNRLTAHQSRSSPFHLTRSHVAATREGLTSLALIRRQEIDGFIEGLFGDEKMVDFPDRANRALNELSQIRAMFAGVVEITADESKPATIDDIKATHRHLREMTRNAEHEIHAIVIACRIARKKMLAGSPAHKPTVH